MTAKTSKLNRPRLPRPVTIRRPVPADRWPLWTDRDCWTIAAARPADALGNASSVGVDRMPPQPEGRDAR